MARDKPAIIAHPNAARALGSEHPRVGECHDPEMHTLVKRRGELGAPAFVVSVLLHAALVPLGAAYARWSPKAQTVELPNSVALFGTSIEVEAPTEDFAALGAAARAQSEQSGPAPVDVRALPTEPDAAEAEPQPSPAPPPERPEPAAGTPKRPPPAPAPRASEPTPRKPPPRPAQQPAAAASGASSPSDGASAAAPAAGTFGQEGLAPGVRRLGYAFTRAIPAATPADSEWHELPPGPVGTVRIELEVDENNRLGELRLWQARAGEPPPPPILKRMVERTLILLRAGQFALSGSNQPGSERLLIEVVTRDEGAEDGAESVVVQKRFDGASPGRPGTAYFRYGTGRAVEAKVTIVPAARR